MNAEQLIKLLSDKYKGVFEYKHLSTIKKHAIISLVETPPAAYITDKNINELYKTFVKIRRIVETGKF